MEIENIKKDQTEMKTTITEMKNTLEGINIRLDKAQDWIGDLEENISENIQSGQQKK